ncbi:hypothetical protein [Synechococcus sp. ROS8604]|uniref:hypothetical protein n=1 Tax=Synechococcus sp. ROS8604 TaxID=1442557 RepID=UPI00185F60A9|nr:hypothetical protein [Synechococcus sp. ROS8604]QNI90227.1 hypothetical protein SynROS8604_03627 [Synechococcus sp. ROS8604]
MSSDISNIHGQGAVTPTPSRDSLQLPDLPECLQAALGRGHTLVTEGTNVVRVPFGVRRSRRVRPERPERWATLVLPLQPHGSPTPPQAA